jgi:LacI family transcriptional regulator
MSMINIKEIAKLAGVSPATVSRVVNGKNYVKQDIRDRVMALVEEHGYVADSAARSMVLKRNFTVGIVLPEAFNMFQRELFSTIERCLEASGYRTLFFFVKWEPESESKCLRRLKAEKLDGIIMIHEVTDPAFYEYLATVPAPVVLCTFAREDRFPSVRVDEDAASQAATRHLIGLGHRNIGLISGTHFSFGAQRAAGYRAALEAAGIPVDEERIVLVPSYSPEEGRAGMHELMARGRNLTAVFAATDELAIGAVRALYEVGLTVPGDLSIVGIDDLEISAFLTPGLTTVRQPIVDMGRKTAEVMSRLIAGQTHPEPPAVFGHRLIVRESSRALGASATGS